MLVIGPAWFWSLICEQTSHLTDLFVFHFQSRARQEDPEQARLKQKAKEVCLCTDAHHPTVSATGPLDTFSRAFSRIT